MTSKDIRKKYIEFFTDKIRKHKEIAPAPLVPENDPTTLFTSSGMQPLVPYLLGQTHPEGKKLVDSQPCFRAEDIEEVGDNRHTTFFEMLGNWSLGEYFKEEQISNVFSLLVTEFGLDPSKLFTTLFRGDENVPRDSESEMLLKVQYNQLSSYFKDIGEITVNDIPENGIKDTDRIFYYGARKNWWSRSGMPEKMPTGEIGGPDCEIFYDFGIERKMHENSQYKDQFCHPNCDCGRFMEICNSVFIQYQKQEDGFFKELPNRNVDFGGGLERIIAASNDNPDIFETNLFLSIIGYVEGLLGATSMYGDRESTVQFRVIADHIKAAVFLIKDGVIPSNKLQGYVLRRLLRRAAVKIHLLDKEKDGAMKRISELVVPVLEIYQGTGYFQEHDEEMIRAIIDEEVVRFEKTLDKGLKEIEKIEKMDGKKAFDLYQTFGFPYEVTEELFREKGQEIDREQFKTEFEKHRELSRTASAGMFKGGLADHSEVTIKYHTATHLLHQALRDVLGESVFQKGSNITAERLRFDFSFDRKMTDEEIKKTEDIINERIKQDLKVDRMIIPIEQAKEMNAIGLFNDKYAKEVSIYGVGKGFGIDQKAKDQRDRGGYYSLEFCGGPHVEHTGEIGTVKIIKEESVSAGMRRIKIALQHLVIE